MVGLAPCQRPGAAGEHTTTVADGQGGPLSGLDDPGGPPDLQRLGRSPTQDRGQQGRRRLEPGRQLTGPARVMGRGRRLGAGVVAGVGVVVMMARGAGG
jgi:hypothetical protein